MSLPSVSVAECATCGTVAAEFGKVWGAAGYFKGSIVTYDITMKTKYLGVPEELALNFMDTPKEVVVAMAKGVTKMFNTRVGLSTSGFATPYPPKGVRVPYIWYAIYDSETNNIIVADKIENNDYLSRGEFQKKVGMFLHVQYMIHFGDLHEES